VSTSPPPPATAAREGQREPQQERSRLTRQRLLEAAIDCLAEYGWSGTTVAVVAERAGMSRGAAQHHFRTREELVTAAVQHMALVRREEIRRQAARLPSGARRTEEVLDLLAGHFVGPVFAAALQLWVAAATDAQLRDVVAPLEARIGRETHRFAVELLGADEARPGVREAVAATLDFMRGLGLANLLTDDSARRRRLLRGWADLLTLALDSRPAASEVRHDQT
jgi:AcrR family transcriptional regulator